MDRSLNAAARCLNARFPLISKELWASLRMIGLENPSAATMRPAAAESVPGEEKQPHETLPLPCLFSRPPAAPTREGTKLGPTHAAANSLTCYVRAAHANSLNLFTKHRLLVHLGCQTPDTTKNVFPGPRTGNPLHSLIPIPAASPAPAYPSPAIKHLPSPASAPQTPPPPCRSRAGS